MNWIPYVQMAGRAKENFPGGSLKYLFVFIKVHIFKCSCRAGLMEVAEPPLGLYVGNLQVWWRLLNPIAEPPLGLYVGNLQVWWRLLNRLWGCTYRGCWTASGAVCWQPTGLIEVAEAPLGLYVGNLQVL